MGAVQGTRFAGWHCLAGGGEQGGGRESEAPAPGSGRRSPGRADPASSFGATYTSALPLFKSEESLPSPAGTAGAFCPTSIGGECY